MKQFFLQVLNSQIVVLDIIISGVSPILIDDTFNFVAMIFVGTVFGAAINSGPQLVLVVSINSQLRVDVGFVLHVRLNGNGSQCLFDVQYLLGVGHIAVDNTKNMIVGTGTTPRISYQERLHY